MADPATLALVRPAVLRAPGVVLVPLGPEHAAGLGAAYLLDAAMEGARANGAAQMDVSTSEDDVAARALYESAGFTNREGGPDGPAMLFYEREL